MKPQHIRRSLPFILLFVLLSIAYVIKTNKPKQSSRSPDSAPQMAVETRYLSASDYSINIESYGTVRPRTQSLLVAQVVGQVIEVADDFENGGFFKKGDTLLKIDDRDYHADVKIAEAALLAAQSTLADEKAKSELALRDWKSLGRKEKPNDLLLRKPQLLAAKAGLISAESNLQKAGLNLERTTIAAPYNGRVMSSNVDLGQVVGMNSTLGEIYASDVLEVRLPIRNRDLSYIDLPEMYQGNVKASSLLPSVDIFSGLIKDQLWHGTVVRTESTIDSDSRQLHVVAEINNPFFIANSAHSKQTSAQIFSAVPQIKIGQYVTAKIQGKTLRNAVVIPTSAIYQGSFVYVVEQQALQRKTIEIVWQNDSDAVITDGVQAGDQLVLSSLGQVFSGTPVVVVNKVEADDQVVISQQGLSHD